MLPLLNAATHTLPARETLIFVTLGPYNYDDLATRTRCHDITWQQTTNYGLTTAGSYVVHVHGCVLHRKETFCNLTQ